MADLFKLTSDAVISPCGNYRYLLRRQLQPKGETICTFIMLNPSTADATANDATIRKCMKFAKAWGWDWLYVVNLFAWRDTSPDAMKLVDFPVGPLNDARIRNVIGDADMVVCAWGKHGKHRGRDNVVRQMLADTHLHFLVLNKDGTPKHPLYCRDDTQPTLWEYAR
ncbi:MAG: DUF1643 domain-containing protein [Rhodanobacter sp.]